MRLDRLASCYRFVVLFLVLACGRSDSTAPGESVASIVIGGAPSGPLLDGSTAQLLATPVNSSGAAISNQHVQWASSDVSIATVNSAGLVLAVGAGSVVITASVGGIESLTALDVRAGGQVTPLGGTLTMLNAAITLVFPSSAVNSAVTVFVTPAKSLVANARLLSGTAFDIGPDALLFFRSVTLELLYDPSKLPSGVTESSLQMYILTGSTWSVVVGSSVNTTSKVVTASITRSGIYAIAGTGVDHIALATAPSIYAGQTTQITATMFDASNNTLTGRAVAWTSSDLSRATIDTAGRVVAVSAGNVTITAVSEGKQASTSLTILPHPVADWSQAIEWAGYQGNGAHTGYFAATVDPTIFKERWVVTAFGASFPQNPVAVGGGAAYASGGAKLTAFDLATGAQRWFADLPIDVVEAVMAPTYANGLVYLQTNDINSYLWGFDATLGTVRFRVGYASQFSGYNAPVVVGQTVYMGCGVYDGLCANSAVDGRSLWFATTNQYQGWTPTVGNGFAYAYDDALTAFDATTGKSAYSIGDVQNNANGSNQGNALIIGASNDLVVTQSNRLLSVDLINRKVAWQVAGPFYGASLANGVIYAINNKQIEARKESDGSLLWLWIPPESQPAGTTIVTNNIIFVTTASMTYAVDLATHQQVWSYPASGQLTISTQGVLLIAQQNGKLAAITVR